MPKSRRSPVYTNRVRCRKWNQIYIYFFKLSFNVNWNWRVLWPFRIQEVAGGRHQRWHLRPLQKASDLSRSGTDPVHGHPTSACVYHSPTYLCAFRAIAMKGKTSTFLWRNRTPRWRSLCPSCCSRSWFGLVTALTPLWLFAGPVRCWGKQAGDRRVQIQRHSVCQEQTSPQSRYRKKGSAMRPEMNQDSDLPWLAALSRVRARACVCSVSGVPAHVRQRHWEEHRQGDVRRPGERHVSRR